MKICPFSLLMSKQVYNKLIFLFSFKVISIFFSIFPFQYMCVFISFVYFLISTDAFHFLLFLLFFIISLSMRVTFSHRNQHFPLFYLCLLIHIPVFPLRSLTTSISFFLLSFSIQVHFPFLLVLPFLSTLLINTGTFSYFLLFSSLFNTGAFSLPVCSSLLYLLSLSIKHSPFFPSLLLFSIQVHFFIKNSSFFILSLSQHSYYIFPLRRNSSFLFPFLRACKVQRRRKPDLFSLAPWLLTVAVTPETRRRWIPWGNLQMEPN